MKTRYILQDFYQMSCFNQIGRRRLRVHQLKRCQEVTCCSVGLSSAQEAANEGAFA